MFKISLNQKDVRAFKQALMQRARKHVAPAMANELKQVVIEHAQQGKDIMRRSFEPYTPAYKKFREAHGLSGSPVDLRTNGKLPRTPAGQGLLDGQKVQGNKLLPGRHNKIAQGLMRKRKFYPENGVGLVRDDMARLIAKGERALETFK